MSHTDMWHWMPLAVVESVLAAHPRASVVFLSNGMPLDFFSCFADAGYDVTVWRYDIVQETRGTLLESFVKSDAWRSSNASSFRYAHESDLLRLVMLYKFGGIYIDTDLLLLRPVDDDILEGSALGVETYNDQVETSKTKGGLRINNAFLAFTRPGHPYVKYVMEKVAQQYDPKEWAAIGPDLITESFRAMPDDVQLSIRLLEPEALYPLHWARAHSVLRSDRTMLDGDWPPSKRGASMGIHLYNSNSYIHQCGGETCSYYRLLGPPPGSWIEEAINNIRLPRPTRCDALRIPAKEARDREAARKKAGG